MSLVSLVVPRCPRLVGGRRQCGGGAPPRGRESEADVVGGCRARRRGAEPGCGRFAVARSVRPRSNARAGIGYRPGSRAGCSEEDGARRAGRCPVRSGNPCAARPRASRNAPRAGGSTAAADRRSRAPGLGNSRSWLGSPGLRSERPKPPGLSWKGCLSKPGAGSTREDRLAPGLLWVPDPRCTRASACTSGAHHLEGCQYEATTARCSPTSLRP